MVRDEVMQRRSASRGIRKQTGAKKVYYLSAEFLVGRTLHTNMVNLVNEQNYLKALDELGIDKNIIFEQEPEPGLGNGGLGRLAACFLDSLTTLKLPAMGCTIRYEFGLFRQKLVDGYQIEVPDNWLDSGNIWEIPRPARDGRGALRRPRDSLRPTTAGCASATRTTTSSRPCPTTSRCSATIRRWSTCCARGRRARPSASTCSRSIPASTSRPMAERRAGRRSSSQDPLSERQLSGQGAAAQAAVLLLVGVDPVCGQRLFEGLWPAVGHLPGQGRRAHQRHASGRGDPRADAHPDGRAHLSWEDAEKICVNTFAYTNHTSCSGGARAWTEQLFAEQLPRITRSCRDEGLCAKRGTSIPASGSASGQGDPRLQPGAHGEPVGLAYSHSGQRRDRHPHEHPQKQTFHDYYVMNPRKFHLDHQRHYAPPLAVPVQPGA